MGMEIRWLGILVNVADFFIVKGMVDLTAIGSLIDRWPPDSHEDIFKELRFNALYTLHRPQQHRTSK